MPPATVPRTGQRTIVVGDGLTLLVSGWTDAEIVHIVEAMRTAIATLKRAEPAGSTRNEL
jgi:hypothetical protein